MTIRTEGDKLFIQEVEVTGSQKAVSGKNAQAMADYFWPGFNNDSLTEELKPRVDELRAELENNSVDAEMLQSTINYLVSAKTKHRRSPEVNQLHIGLVLNLLKITRDQMFPGFTNNW